MPARPRHFALLLIISLLSSCALRIVQPSTDLLGAEVAAPPESRLVDIGITIFTPLDEPIMEQAQEQVGLQNLRNAESHYASWQLAQALEKSGQWGTVRLNPFFSSGADLTVSGTILQSDGETMRVQIDAVDASGVVWLDTEYLQVVNAEDYGKFWDDIPAFPFQSLINRIANDLLAFREKNRSAADLAYIHKAASLQFAAKLAPDLYGTYLEEGKITRLPASNDAIFSEIQSINDRNKLFLDAIGMQYTVFANQINRPYRNFLKRSQQITTILNSRFVAENIERSATPTPLEMAGFTNSRGKAGGNLGSGRTQSDRLNRGGRRARMYASALAEANTSFEMEVQPQTVEFSNHTVELSGTLEEQFAEWQQILGEIQRLETNK